MLIKNTLIAAACSMSFALSLPAFAENATGEGQATSPTTEQGPQKSPAERRTNIRNMAQQTLEEIHKKYPESEQSIEKAAGYAVFNTGSVQFIFAGAGGGDGVAVSKGKETFMGVAQVKGGLGLGVKNSRLVLVFTSQKAFHKFVTSGWAFSGDATAAAKVEGKGVGLSGASLIAPDVYAYQITESGLTAEVTVAGTKYFVDKQLNAGKS
ncbi:lipid-binding SYLF domain-containing protein [Andreprevotia chitinilytica]|uniref:lipid-binding SYLF domain-containing protein n=1 Tax=Andreprevotia chitinilytica TaxID=396808 RepID=UPI00068BE6F0|nr:YSC84-related protein [Andreprevotia chitinilytica]